MRNINVPFERSYWVLPGKFLAGAYPGSRKPQETTKNLKALLEYRVRHVINLMEEDEVNYDGKRFESYEQKLSQIADMMGIKISCIRMPIRDLDVPSSHTMTSILNEIDEAISQNRPVYVHCWGGRGRTGTVVGCYLVRHGLSGEEVLTKISELRRNEPRADMPSPETYAQREMVISWGNLDNRKYSRQKPSKLERYRGCLLGLAVGDALGTTLEFKSPGSFKPIKDIVGGGPFRLKPGEWSDDTSMAL